MAYCLRYNGTILTGPNAGQRLSGHLLESLFIGEAARQGLTYSQQQLAEEDAEQWIARARKDKVEGRFDGTIEVCWREYVYAKRAKDRHFKMTVVYTA